MKIDPKLFEDYDEKQSKVVQRRYVSETDVHYAGGLAAGSFAISMFGDAATELCVLNDGSEGLFAGYDSVSFKAPIHAGDMVECVAEIVGKGTRSRKISFALSVTARRVSGSASGDSVKMTPPLLVASAIGTVVVPHRGEDAA